MDKGEHRRLLVFGSGFIARFLVQEAQEQGFVVKVLYRQHPVDDMPKLDQQKLDPATIDHDVLRFSPNYVVAVQGSSFVPDNDHLIGSLETNLVSTIVFMEVVNRLMASGSLSVEKILMIGSAGEYGKMYSEPISESFPLHPTSIYGLTKIFLYNTALFYHEKGLPVCYVRQFNCTGPYQRPVFVVPSICRQIALIEKGKLNSLSIGDVTQERDFIDVRDAVRAHLTVLKSGRGGEIYNVGTGRSVPVKQVLDLALDQAREGIDISLETDPNLFVEKNALSKRLCADISKLKKLGFAPRIPLESTVRDTLDYWRARV